MEEKHWRKLVFFSLALATPSAGSPCCTDESKKIYVFIPTARNVQPNKRFATQRETKHINLKINTGEMNTNIWVSLTV